MSTLSMKKNEDEKLSVYENRLLTELKSVLGLDELL